MTVLGIDPGPEQSAWVLWDGARVKKHGKEHNFAVLAMLQDSAELFLSDEIVFEEIASYGMPVGVEVFETVFWTGRFFQVVPPDTRHRLRRSTVKQHICHDSRAKDSNIRQALIDRFGGQDRAIGKKKTPGPLYGIHGDCWQALALAVTFYDQQQASGARVEAVLR